MKKLALIFGIALLSFGYSKEKHQSWIRINQLGYQPNTIKVAVIGSKDKITVKEFTLHNSKTNEIVATFNKVESKGQFGPFETSFRLDF